MEQLPLDIIKQIFAFIPYRDEENMINYKNIKLTCKRFLFASKFVFDPSVLENAPIIWSASNGYLSSVKELMEDERVNPSARRSLALCFSVANNHLPVAIELLKDKRIDPMCYSCYAFYAACNRENFSLLEVIMKHKDFDHTYFNKKNLDSIVREGSWPIISRLLKDKRLKQVLIGTPLLKRSVLCGRLGIVLKVLFNCLKNKLLD